MKNKPNLLLTAVALGIMLNPLNTSMISVAFARLQEEFHLSFADISWLISTYYLASAIAQPVMGKLSDLFGRKRLFILGLLLVTCSSLLAPLSPSFGWLIGFRALQAIGTSTLFPAGMGIVRQAITGKQARALGVLSVFSSTSAAFGPSLGGFLIHAWDWPAIFIVNFPVIVVSLLLSLKVLPKDEPVRGARVRLDAPGIVLFSAAIMLWLLFFLAVPGGSGWLWLWLVAGLAASWGLYRYEYGREQPFIDVVFLKTNRNVTLIYVQFILVNFVFYSIMFGIPSYLEAAHHFDVRMTGVVMLAIAGFSVLATPLAGRWIDARGPYKPLMLGATLACAGTLLMLTFRDGTSAGWMFAVLTVSGVSTGLNNLGMQTALYRFVSKAETGIASGLFMTSRYLGTILSSSLLSAVFGKQITSGKLHVMALVCALIGAAMLLLTLRLLRADGSGRSETAERQG
ncbi:MFS transporter [Paenibacillus athensensis]|nr:MFS transporter [Paenibacillus athensensis]